MTPWEVAVIRRALNAIWSVLPEHPARELGVFDHLADIDRIVKAAEESA